MLVCTWFITQRKREYTTLCNIQHVTLIVSRLTSGTIARSTNSWMSSLTSFLFFDTLYFPLLCNFLFSSHLSLPFLPPSRLMGFNISRDSRLIDRWELAMCKHFMHPFASHHPWHHRSQAPSTPTGPLHIAFSAGSCFFTVGERTTEGEFGLWWVLHTVWLRVTFLGGEEVIDSLRRSWFESF